MSVTSVMAGLVPAIHVFTAVKTWMPGTRPSMTNLYVSPNATLLTVSIANLSRVHPG